MWKLDYEESWAPKNWCFWTVVLERTLYRVPWTSRRSNESILKEISPGISLEGMMLKLKLQYFGHLMRRVDSLERTLILGGIWGRRRRGQQRMRWLDGITDSMETWVWVNSWSWWWRGRPGVLRFMGSQRVGRDWATELNLTDWTRCHDLCFFECWVFSQLFHFPLSPSSRGSLVPPHFLPLEWYHLHI